MARRRRRRAHRRLVGRGTHAVVDGRRRRARCSSTCRRSAARARTPTGRAATSSRGRWAATCTSPARPTASRSGCPARRPSCTPAPTPRSPPSSACTSASAAAAARRVEVADLDAALTAHAWLVSSWAACGAAARSASRSTSSAAADGWVYVMRIVPKDELFVMIERPDLGDENLTVDIPTWNANIPRIFEAVAEWAHGQDGRRDRRARPAAARRRHAGRSTAPACSPTSSSRPATGGSARATSPSPASRTSSRPRRGPRRGPAPALGEHSATAPPPPARPSRPPATGGDRPARRSRALRIIEVTTNWAGPVAGRFLADLGADSVKVEWATRPATRALVWVGPVPGPAAPAPPPRHVLLRDEPQQARRVHRPGQARRPGGVPRARQVGRRRAREQQRPGDAEPRPRLRGPARPSTRRSSWCRCRATAATARTATGSPTAPTSRRPAR